MILSLAERVKGEMLVPTEELKQAIVAERGALAANRKPDHRPKRGGRAKSFAKLELWHLPGAGRFSADPTLCGPLTLIAEWRRRPFAVALRELADTSPTSFGRLVDVAGFDARKLGRPRLPGDWPSLYLAYVLSGCPALQAWYNVWHATPLWQVCGFTAPPAYPTVHLRFTELEENWSAFVAVAQDLIRHAKASEQRIGEFVFVDATGWKTSSVLEHACQDEEACQRAGGNPPLRLQTDINDEVLEAHWAETEAVPDEDDRRVRTKRGVITIPRASGALVEYALFEINGHIYRSLDTSSGLRRYGTAKQWFGGYLLAAVDFFTGLPVAAQVFAADIQEWNGYPALFADMLAALGEPPYVVSVDKGFGTRAFHEFNTRRGVAVVGPRRKQRNRTETRDWRTDAFDEHGIPRCQHCGGVGDQDSPGMGLFFIEDGEPKIRFRCVLPYRPECKRVQSIHCGQEWLLLGPLSRTRELYHAVRFAHSNKENAFGLLRDRFGIAGKDLTGQLARPGVPPQRLRAAAGLLLEWFRLNLRQGWLAPIDIAVQLNMREAERLSGIQDRTTGDLLEDGVGSKRLAEFLREREEAHLELPYGKAWQEAQRRREQEPAR